MTTTNTARELPGVLDMGPLSWVKGEIDQSFDRGLEALARFVGAPGDAIQLRSARNQVHQAAGALRMVGLDAVTVFTDEIEASLAWMETAPPAALPVMAQAIDGASRRLRLHLDELLNGAPPLPLRLFPEYQAMQNARGITAASPVDLFFPDLSIRPARAGLGQQLDATQLATLLTKARRVFQQGLLGWLRGAPEGLQQMRAAVQAIEHTQSGPQRAFWWTTTAFLDALLWRGLEAGYSSKQLCARIDLQIRRFIEGSAKVADRLRREVLYHVAISRPVTAMVEEVRNVYGLAALIPSARAADADLVRVQPALRAARTLLVPAKDAWLRLNSGRPDALAKLKQHLAALVEKVEEIGHPDLLRLTRALASALERMPVDPVPDAVALEYATGLLLAESALENFAALAPDFGRNVDAMVARIECGGAIAGEAPAPMLDEMARRAQERLLLAQVAKEIQSNLRHIEQVLDAFFRDHARRGELAALGQYTRQVKGALSMLGLERAERLLSLCQEQIDLYARPETPVTNEDLELLAESLSGLGFYIEAIEQQRDDGDRLIEPLLRKRLGVAEQIRRERETSLESTLEARLAALSPLVAGLSGPGATVSLAALRQRLTAARHDAELTANAALGAAAATALTLLDDPSPAGRAALAAAVAKMVNPAAVEPAPGPSADALRLVSVTKEKLDAELLDIYLSEATEVLGVMGENLERLRHAPDDRDTLRTVRRGFHTLKGSGRMVGLTELGELAWSVEQVHNRWLEDERVASQALLALIETAQGCFRRWVDALQAYGEVTIDASTLDAAVARAQAELGPRGPGGPGGGGVPRPPSSTPGPATEGSMRPAPALRLVEPMARSEGAAGSGGARTALDSPSTVCIGEVTMSVALHQILCDEALQHLRTLQAGQEALQRDHSLTPSDAMVRASHTLKGIHRTSGLAVVADAAQALEHCLHALQEADERLPDEALPVLAGAVALLAGLLARVRAAEPFPAEQRRAAEDCRAALDALRGRCASREPARRAAAWRQLVPGAGVDLDALLEQSGARMSPEGVAETTLSDDVRALAIAIEAAEPGAPEPPAGGSEFGGLTSVRDEIDLDLLPIFLEEAHELFPQAGEDLRAWQRNPQDRAAANRLQRTLHTFKGSARMAGAMRLGELTHLMESRLLAGESLVVPTAELFEALDTDLDRVGWLIERLQRNEFDTSLPWLDEGVEPVPGLPADSEGRASDAISHAAPGDGGATAVVDAVEAAPAPTLAALDSFEDAPVSAAEVARDQAEALAAFAELDALDTLPPIDEIAVADVLALAGELTGELAGELADGLTAALSDAQAASTTAADAQTASTITASAQTASAIAAGTPDAVGIGEMPGSQFETEALGAEATGPAATAPAMPPLPAEADLGAALATALDEIGVLLRAAEPPAAVPPPAPIELPTGTPVIHIVPSPASGIIDAPADALPSSAGWVGAPAAASGDGSAEAEPRERAMLRVRADVVDRLVNEAGEVSIARARVEGELRALKSNLLELTGSVMRLRAQVRELEMHAETQIQSRLTQVQESASAFDPLEFDRFTRFQELTRSLVEGISDVSAVQQSLLKNIDDADAALVSQARMSRDVQQALFSIRTTPFASLSDRLHRVVRQTAKELGKRAALDIRGGQVELDRSVLEKLVGPFEHLLRNSIDHGIEGGDARRAAGKPEAGQLSIAVRQQGNEVVIELDDDGAGVDYARLAERARALGLTAAGADPARAQLIDAMFSPGLTTARAVTKISGRGIGLDVVRSDIAALGGRIEVTSEPGKGTRFTLILPLTLAVAQVALVRVAGRLYALPAPMVDHVQQVKPNELIDLYVKRELAWQGRAHPFYNLGRLLGDDGHTPDADRHNSVLLVRSGGNLVAIHVDEMVGNQEVVVKNIGPQLARVIGITGATVLGTGEVVLIINPVQLALRYDQVVAAEVRATASLPLPLPLPKAEAPAHRVLVVDDSLTVRKITSRFLVREGYEVLTARDGVEALQMLADSLPDIILLDIEMPRMDGFELARAVRGDRRTAGLPIVMITSRTADKHRQHARELGVQGYLGKPWQEDELLAAIRTLIGSPEVLPAVA